MYFPGVQTGEKTMYLAFMKSQAYQKQRKYACFVHFAYVPNKKSKNHSQSHTTSVISLFVSLIVNQFL